MGWWWTSGLLPKPFWTPPVTSRIGTNGPETILLEEAGACGSASKRPFFTCAFWYPCVKVTSSYVIYTSTHPHHLVVYWMLLHASRCLLMYRGVSWGVAVLTFDAHTFGIPLKGLLLHTLRIQKAWCAHMERPT